MLLALEGPVAGELAQLVKRLSALPEDPSLALTPGCSQPPGSPGPGDLTPSKGRHLHSCDTQPCTIKNMFLFKEKRVFSCLETTVREIQSQMKRKVQTQFSDEVQMGNPAFVCEATMDPPILNFTTEQTNTRRQHPLLSVIYNLRAFAARQTESLRGVDRLISEGEEEGRKLSPSSWSGKREALPSPGSLWNASPMLPRNKLQFELLIVFGPYIN